MPRRSRSILVDTTIGKIFTNVQSVSAADASNLIAGTQTKRGGFSSPKTQTTRLTSNLGGKSGFYFPVSGVVTEVSLTSVIAPKGAAVQVNLKRGTTYESSTIVGTYTLAELTTSSTTSTAITVSAGDNFYVDIVSVGTTVPGSGLEVRFKYYLG